MARLALRLVTMTDFSSLVGFPLAAKILGIGLCDCKHAFYSVGDQLVSVTMLPQYESVCIKIEGEMDVFD